jgi:hypothetical protein
MKINVLMLAFGRENEVREVEVPDEKAENNQNIDVVLDLVYYYGQNDFQPQNHPSVSMADVIVYNDEKYLVCYAGFRKLTEIEFDEFLKLPHSGRNNLARKPTL